MKLGAFTDNKQALTVAVEVSPWNGNCAIYIVVYEGNRPYLIRPTRDAAERVAFPEGGELPAPSLVLPGVLVRAGLVPTLISALRETYGEPDRERELEGRLKATEGARDMAQGFADKTLGIVERALLRERGAPLP